MNWPEEAWREITVGEGSQGSRSYVFSAQRVRPTSRRKPGEIHWAVYRRNLDGSEPRYYLSNAPEDTPLETLAYMGGSRWRIETEFETEKSDVGLDEYETRTWAGWHHHVALCLLGGAFLLSLQQAWGECEYIQRRDNVIAVGNQSRECPSCPWMGLWQAHFKCRIIVVIRYLRRP